jgi:DNA repair photolyase
VPARLVPPAAAVPFVRDLGASMDLAMRQTLPGGPRRIGQGLRLDVSELFDSLHLGITPLTPSLILGAKADPYPPAEATQRRTRRLLEDVRENQAISGLEISILTRSPLLLRDLDLLVDLDQRHAVTVSILIPAAEAKLASRLEASAPSFHPVQSTRPALSPAASSPPSPNTRFELVHTLAAHGIATQVLCTPVQPGLNNSVAVLRRLFDRAHNAGASDVCPAPRHPALRPTAAESRQLLALFHRLRLERGFPRTLPGRG